MALFKRSPLKATKLHQRKRRMRLFVVIFSAILFLLAFGLVVWFAHLERFEIKSVDVKGNIAVETEDIMSVAEKAIDGSYVLFFPRANKLIYPRATLVRDILQTFPEVGKAEVEVKGQVLSVEVVERKPKFLWCKGDGVNKDSDCYFMDDTGFVFSVAPRFSGNAYFVYYGNIVDADPIGKQFLSVEDFKALSDINRTLAEKDIHIDACTVKDNGVRELHLTRGGVIIFKSGQDNHKLVSSLDLVRNETELLSPNATTTLKYIDFRFGNKVYYTFVGDNSPSSL